jgi:hypothetical protein
MTENAAGVDVVWPMENGAVDWKHQASRLSSISGVSRTTSFRQEPSGLLILTFRRINVLIDRLIAQSRRGSAAQP